MALSIIGPGFGRTGTKSLKEALEQLGFGPCHHMYEVVEDPPQAAHWQAMVAGGGIDCTAAFAGYTSQVDWPGAHVWRESAAAFPDARVIHSTRPSAGWWNSYSRTIGKLLQTYQSMELPPHIRDIMDACSVFIRQDTFGGRQNDREACIAAFEKREADVRAEIAPERLLVFEVSQGWEPLCAYLGVPVPDTQFPHHNLRADFWERLGGEPA
jgi:sulfotransferase family protein